MHEVRRQKTEDRGQKAQNQELCGSTKCFPLTPVSEASVPCSLKGTFLAFDFGTKRIGVAVGNSFSGTAQPLITLHGEQNEQRFAAIGSLIREWQPVALIVGLPCNDDGSPHELTRLCRRFSNRLKGRFDLTVILVDERFTSAAASSQLNEAGVRGIKQKPLLDQVAAQQILEAYLNEPLAGIFA